ncbi:MAG: azurin [Balneolaceae bacterium]
MNLLLTVLLTLFIGNATVSPDKAEDQVQNRVEIVIEGNDQMRFNLSEINVKAGDTVVLTLKHTGKLPKAAMGHNWVLLAEGTNVQEFATTAIRARDNEYIPAEGDDVLAHTALIGGGEETTIEFTAPAAGEYDFICSFPGHYSLMKGKLIVE